MIIRVTTLITGLSASTTQLPAITAVEEEDSAEEDSVAVVADAVDAVEIVGVAVEDVGSAAAEVEEDVEVVAVASDSVVEGVEDLPSKARRLHSKLLLVR